MPEGQLDSFLDDHIGKKIICFGAGEQGKRAKKILQDEGYEVVYFSDNAKIKWGDFVEGIEVISPDKMKKLYAEGGFSILVTSAYHKEIEEQLIEMGIG